MLELIGGVLLGALFFGRRTGNTRVGPEVDSTTPRFIVYRKGDFKDYVLLSEKEFTLDGQEWENFRKELGSKCILVARTESYKRLLGSTGGSGEYSGQRATYYFYSGYRKSKKHANLGIVAKIGSKTNER